MFSFQVLLMWADACVVVGGILYFVVSYLRFYFKDIFNLMTKFYKVNHYLLLLK